MRTEKKHISVQRQEFEYQKQQLERRYVKLKQDRAQLAQQSKALEELFRQFTDSVQKAKLLQAQTGKPGSDERDEKIEEFIQLMKGIHYMLQVMVTQNRQTGEAIANQRSLEEQKQGPNPLGHLQQESTSSCATNSTGNYNFIMQGSTLFHPSNSKSSPYQAGTK